MKYCSLILSFLWGSLYSAGILAQDSTATIDGILRYGTEASSVPGSELQVILPALRRLQVTDAAGQFNVTDIPRGTYTLIVRKDHETIDSFRVVPLEPLTHLGILYLREPGISNSKIPEEPTEDNSNTVVNDDGIPASSGTSILLSASNRDPFLTTSGFVLSAYGFRNRGYYRYSPQVLINGISMNDISSGNPLWTIWSGLNDAFRNVQSTYALAASESAFGNISGVTAYTLAPQDQARQTRFSYALSNRSYDHRLMINHYTGLSAKGWAAGITASMRRAEESYRPGTSFRSYSLLFSIYKQINAAHEAGLTAFAVPAVKSKYTALTDEAAALSGNPYYNPNWGWQNGSKRNAREVSTFIPVAILHHHYHASELLHIRTAIAFSTGSIRNAALDWYQASDPRPDYYRNLPSYYNSTDPATAEAITRTLKEHPEQLQLNWNRLYTVNSQNQETLAAVDGIPGNSFSGNRSLYVLAHDVERISKISMNTVLESKLSRTGSLHAGLSYTRQQSVYYRELADLLGGDYFLNYNVFAAQQYSGNTTMLQQDLDHPNRVIRKGDQYSYHYSNQLRQASAWVQPEYNFRKISLFLSAQAQLRQYQREGFYRNGLFSTTSAGTSPLFTFLNHAAKAGITIKLNGRNYLFAHSLYSREDPGYNAIFISPRTRNQVTEQVLLQTTKSMEAGYLMKAPSLNIRVVAYATDITQATDIQRFYNDDPEFQGFVNFVMADMNMRFTGTELALAYTLSPSLTLHAVAAAGQAFYTNRPRVNIYRDNDTVTTPGTRAIFIKNYYLGAGPQSAYSTGISYTGRKYWYAQLNCSYLDRNYIAVNPTRRSREAAGLTDPNDPLYHRILDQEKLPPVFSIDVSGGKSFRLHKLYSGLPYALMLYLNAGISNLLNNRQMKSGGYEQLRYDFSNNNPDKFPNKYIYAPGRTFFINLSIKR